MCAGVAGGGRECRAALLAQKARERRVHRVAGLVRDDVPEHRASDEREVSEEVERLVAHELVREAQVAVLDAVVADHDAVVLPGASGESVRLERLVLGEEPERASRRDVRGVATRA